jgi:hypothetical protein
VSKNYDSEREADAAASELAALLSSRFPNCGKVSYRVGTHPISGKFTLTLCLLPGEWYPLEVRGMTGFRGKSVTVMLTK